MTFGQDQEKTLTLHTHSISSLHLPNFKSQAAIVSEKSTILFLKKSISYKIWDCRKISQCQPRVIFWTNYDGQESPMQHSKFHGNQSTSTREKDF